MFSYSLVPVSVCLLGQSGLKPLFFNGRIAPGLVLKFLNERLAETKNKAVCEELVFTCRFDLTATLPLSIGFCFLFRRVVVVGCSDAAGEPARMCTTLLVLLRI